MILLYANTVDHIVTRDDIEQLDAAAAGVFWPIALLPEINEMLWMLNQKPNVVAAQIFSLVATMNYDSNTGEMLLNLEMNNWFMGGDILGTQASFSFYVEAVTGLKKKEMTQPVAFGSRPTPIITTPGASSTRPISTTTYQATVYDMPNPWELSNVSINLTISYGSRVTRYNSVVNQRNGTLFGPNTLA